MIAHNVMCGGGWCQFFSDWFPSQWKLRSWYTLHECSVACTVLQTCLYMPIVIDNGLYNSISLSLSLSSTGRHKSHPQV